MTIVQVILISLISGVLGFILGILVGLLIYSLCKDSEDNVEKPTPSPNEEDSLEILRLWRRKKSGKLIPKLDGVYLLSSSQMSDQQRDRLVQVMVEFDKWTRAPLLPQTPSEQPVTPTPNVSQSFSSSTETIPSPQEALKPSSTPPFADSLPESVGVNNMFSYSPFKKKGESEGTVSSDSPKSVALQIDEILQARLVDFPLADRAVHLMELPGKGMVIMVGLTLYADVNEIPDSTIQALIKEAATEWINRTKKNGE